jgi:MFS family permease
VGAPLPTLRILDLNASLQPSHPPPRAFAALRTPGFGAYLFGSMLAMMADSIEHVISWWMMFEKFRSPALGGFAVLSHWLPFLLFSLHAGALADRFDPRRIIQVAMLLYMLCSLAWGALFLLDALEIWHAVVILSVHGIAGVLWAPASQIMIHDIAGRAQLHSAVRLLATSRVLGLLGGPAVGGVLLLAFGGATGILLNALIYVPLTVWLWRAPFGPRFRTEATTQPLREMPGLAGVLATMRDVAGNRVVVSMTVVAGVSSLLVGNAYQAQMPEFAADLGHVNADVYYSMLLGANAAGALVAGLALETIGIANARPRAVLVLVLLWCLSIGGFAISASYPLSLALLFVGGVLNLTFSSMAQTLVQLHAPPQMRGRVIGVFNMFFHGLRAFSGVTVGMGGSLIGVHWSLGVSAAVLLVITLGLLAAAVRAPAQAG